MDSRQIESKPTLNNAQKYILDSTIAWPINDIVQSCLTEPLIANAALTLAMNGMPAVNTTLFDERGITSSIQQIAKILNHPYPQNRAQDSDSFGLSPDTSLVVYKNAAGLAALEKRGLLSLSALNNNEALPVTKKAVVDYIYKMINDAQAELKLLTPELIAFIKNNQLQVNELWESSEAIRLKQLIEIGPSGLAKLIENLDQTVRLLNKVNISAKELVSLDDSVRHELTAYSDDMIRLQEAHLSVQDILSLAQERRHLFWKYSSRIHDLIQDQDSTFTELKALSDEEFLQKMLAPRTHTLPIMLPSESVTNNDLPDSEININPGVMNGLLSGFQAINERHNALLPTGERTLSPRLQAMVDVEMYSFVANVLSNYFIVSNTEPETAPTQSQVSFATLFPEPVLNQHQVSALSILNSQGLRPLHLLNWHSGGNQFSVAHRDALINLMLNENHSPAQAIRAINGITEVEARVIADRRSSSWQCLIV